MPSSSQSNPKNKTSSVLVTPPSKRARREQENLLLGTTNSGEVVLIWSPSEDVSSSPPNSALRPPLSPGIISNTFGSQQVTGAGGKNELQPCTPARPMKKLPKARLAHQPDPRLSPLTTSPLPAQFPTPSIDVPALVASVSCPLVQPFTVSDALSAEDTESEPVDVPEGHVMCELCDKVVTKATLSRHLRTKCPGVDRPPMVCEDCGQIFQSHREDSFKRHVKNGTCDDRQARNSQNPPQSQPGGDGTSSHLSEECENEPDTHKHVEDGTGESDDSSDNSKGGSDTDNSSNTDKFRYKVSLQWPIPVYDLEEPELDPDSSTIPMELRSLNVWLPFVADPDFKGLGSSQPKSTNKVSPPSFEDYPDLFDSHESDQFPTA